MDVRKQDELQPDLSFVCQTLTAMTEVEIDPL